MKTKRAAIALISAVLALPLASREAVAFLLRGGVASSGGGPTQLTYVVLTNTSGSTLASGSVSQMRGFPFKEGDIPAGTWPQFYIAGGTATSVPCTLLSNLATYWPDGSLKFVPGMISNPQSISAGASVNIGVFTSGSLPSSSSRSLSDCTNSLDPQLQLDLLDPGWRTQLTGYVADLGGAITGSSALKTVSYGNGACGGFWRVTVNVEYSGSPDGQMICDFYIASLANSNGSFKGLRFAVRPRMPYYDLNTNAKDWVSFSRLQFVDANTSTVLCDAFGNATTGYNFGLNRAVTFTATNGVTNLTYTSGTHWTTNFGGDFGYAVQATTTGTLPAGISANTTYFTQSPSASALQIGTNSYLGGKITPTGSGSGTHTLTPYPYISYFGSVWLINANATMLWVQGAGSDSSDTPLRISLDSNGQNYWLSTLLFPPWDLTISSPNECPSVAYWPNCSGPVNRDLEGTGERLDLGVINGWSVIHFYNQTATDDTCVRTVSFVGGHFAADVKNSTTLSLPCCNNGHNGGGGTYSGMPAPSHLFRWQPTVTSSQWTNTTNASVQIAGFLEQDTSHMPQFNYYAYMAFGEPMHFDMLSDFTSNAISTLNGLVGTTDISLTSWSFDTSNSGGGVRNVTFGATTYYGGVALASGEDRVQAWALRDIAWRASIAPATDHDVAGYTEYFIDLFTTSGQVLAALYAEMQAQSMTYAYNNGLGNNNDGQGSEPNPTTDPWQKAYRMDALCAGAAGMQDANWQAALSNDCLFFDNVVSTFGGWHVGCEQISIRTANAIGSPLNTANSQMAFANGVSIYWSSSTNLFTLNSVVSNNTIPWTPNVGGTIVFSWNAASFDTATPAGFNNAQAYYIVNVTGSGPGATFQLSATPNGSPITLTDSNSNSNNIYYVTWGPSPPADTTGSSNSSMNNEGYNTICAGTLSWATALGYGPLTATVTDLRTRNTSYNSGAGINYATDPRYARSVSFP